jgi:KipI family sensor histidine kinase inhibitor
VPRLLAVGEAAFSVELGDGIDPAVAARVRGLDQALAARAFPWLREAVPTYRSLLVVFDPAAREEVEARLSALSAAAPAPAGGGRLHEVPVVYGGEDGPDLAEVAAHCRLSEAELVARHGAQEYLAYMLGFMPGFAYLGLLPPELETSRRATPRVRVPAGAVAVAGRQTGVYPFSTPGGWNLLGRTSLALFDPRADPPALFAPGDRVRFRSVEVLPQRPAAARDEGAGTAGDDAAEVLAPGLLTTVQDGGRRGWRRSGVSWAGAFDAPALARANAAVGNPPGAAALECTLQGPTLRFLRAVRVAVAGADLGAVLERPDLGAWTLPPGQAVLARPGNVIRFSGRRGGCRAYLALAGGVAAADALGSRATDLSAGFGGLHGRALRAGDRVAARASAPSERAVEPRGGGGSGEEPPTGTAGDRSPTGSADRLRVMAGPQSDAFDEEARRALLGSTFTVRPESDRVGCRLAGMALVHGGPREIVSDGMLPGCIQVPPDGQPIVMGPDGPTTGGYPKIAVVIGADLPRLAQLAPGETVRFREVTPAEAVRALEER